MDSPGFKVRAGSVIGYMHKTKGMNNQDSFHYGTLEIAGRQYDVGVVSDGCTNKIKKGQLERSRTEAGSYLLTQYAFGEIATLLTLGVPLAEIPQALYGRCVVYIGNVARCSVSGGPEQIASFIERTFLASLVSYICDGQKLLVLWSGDGAYGVNDEARAIDQNDAPLYMAYHQIDRSLLLESATKLPTNFETAEYDLANVKRFWIATDGLIQKEGQAQPTVALADVANMFSHEPQARMGLQWWLNIQQLETRFKDDTTVITAVR